jgi:HEPN domain-containing protein
MKPERLPPDDPREWIRRARSNLLIAGRFNPREGVELADLCFEAQQCAEKSVKAVFLKRGQTFPYVHDLQRLLKLLADDGLKVPAYVSLSVEVT